MQLIIDSGQQRYYGTWKPLISAGRWLVTFADFFRSGWKNSDSGKRLDAVNNLTNQTILAKIATVSENRDVRLAAAGRLTEHPIPSGIFQDLSVLHWDSEASYGSRVVERLTDEVILAHLARKAAHTGIRKAAVEKLKDQDVLAEIASNDFDSKVRMAAIGKINDNERLAQIARTAMLFQRADVRIAPSPDTGIRLEAVRRIKSQALLADLAINSYQRDVRLEAARKVTDQPLLSKIARSAPSGIVQISGEGSSYFVGDPAGAVISRLDDQKILGEIALDKKRHESVRRRAIERMTDQPLLAELARSDSDAGVRRGATERLADQTVLAEIAMNDESRYVRLEAAKRLSDRSLANRVFAEIAMGRSSGECTIRLEAVRMLDDQALLADVVRHADWEGIGWGEENTYNYKDSGCAAFAKLSVSQALLEDLARNAEMSSVRCELSKMLTNPLSLAEIAKNDPDKYVRETAAERLKEQTGIAK
jgi:hypothetical protein